ncbi:phenol hydroxylase subunit P4 [Sphingobium phenoxybenzoativorans]|uniref:Phenol hydroxylase activator protein n=1 Tax=Sphingobium phenoxybenzoativorans TaxID=1592790 RepID=A0A1W5YR23_9SPHN|nr:phenol hydroxylase subunit P4 [Sphingobium phenoxybenzoativorans]ARI47608.1 phenol hydroxylase activator protein [Sphingobium phenoxybenzoativorans]
MAVVSISPYKLPAKDALENFHGNQLVYLHWEDHLMFCAPVAFPLPSGMVFDDLVQNVLGPAYQQHPDFSNITWSDVKWTLDGKPFDPDPQASLADNGVGHKSLLSFVTPGLQGIGNKHF